MPTSSRASPVPVASIDEPPEYGISPAVRAGELDFSLSLKGPVAWTKSLHGSGLRVSGLFTESEIFPLTLPC